MTGKPIREKEKVMPQREICAFSLPGIAFGSKHVPILSLIEHPLKLKMGSIPGKEENPFIVDVEPVYQAHIIDEQIFIAMNGKIRDSIEVNKVFIVYRDYVPQGGLAKRRIRLLDDIDTLKIVSAAVFIKVYQLIMGRKIELNDKGAFDSTKSDIVEFIVSRRFITPGIMKTWNRNDELRTYLPYRIWIDEGENANLR